MSRPLKMNIVANLCGFRAQRWETGHWATGLKRDTTSLKTSPTSTASYGGLRTEAGCLASSLIITSLSRKTPLMVL